MLIQQLLTVDKDVKNLLYTWGRNHYGQLGTRVNLRYSSPVQIGSSSWSTISTGQTHTLALNSSGQLYAWGANNSGQLGDGTTIPRSTPVLVASASWTWTKIVAGYGASFAISSSGALWAWGSNLFGQLGTGNTTNRSVPIQIGTGSVPASGSWTVVANGGRGFTAAIRSDGTLFTWGYNTLGCLGDGTTTTKSSPVQIGSGSWVSASLGARTSFAISSSGALFGWGYNSAGNLGDGTTVNKSSPIQVGTGSVAISGSWIAVSTARQYTLAIRSDNRLFAWGNNSYGPFGDGTQTSTSSPVIIGTGSWSVVSTGHFTTFAINTLGQMFSWGRSVDGILGDGAPLGTRTTPRQIGTGSSWTAVQAAFSNTFGAGTNITALRSDGLLFMWGGNKYGQFDDGYRIQEENLQQIPTTNISWRILPRFGPTGNQNSSGVIRSDGLLFTWGRQAGGGILGDGTLTLRNSPVQIGSSSWTAVSMGDNHSAGIRSDGQLYTWGGNASYGALGDGTTTNRSSPIQVGTGSVSTWTAVAVSNAQTLAIRSDGLLFAWGLNASGQLGDGTTVNKSSPVQIGSSSWTAVAVGTFSSMAIRSDGALFQWGGGGALPINTATSSPVLAVSGSWTTVSISAYHGMAISSSGALFAWGLNASGQLGDGTTTTRRPPVRVGTGSLGTWVSAVVGVNHTAAIRSDGALFTWGLNSYGQLGDGTFINKSSPVQIGASSWTAVAAGGNHTMAIIGKVSNIQKTR